VIKDTTGIILLGLTVRHWNHRVHLPLGVAAGHLRSLREQGTVVLVHLIHREMENDSMMFGTSLTMHLTTFKHHAYQMPSLIRHRMTLMLDRWAKAICEDDRQPHGWGGRASTDGLAACR